MSFLLTVTESQYVPSEIWFVFTPNINISQTDLIVYSHDCLPKVIMYYAPITENT